MDRPSPNSPVPSPTSAPGRTRSPLRRYASRLLLAAVVTLATLKLADVIAGAAARTGERYLLRLTPNVEVRHKSNEFDYLFRTNELGLRGPRLPFEKPVDAYRIVVLGDSFVAGYGVADEDLLTSRLQETLAADESLRRAIAGPDKRIEVINVGRVGSSTIRELDVYESLGRRFAPDLVILGYYLGNDLAEVMHEQTDAEFAAWHPEGTVRRTAYAGFPNLYLELAMIRQSNKQNREFASRSEEEVIENLRREAQGRGRDPDAAVATYRTIPQNVRDTVAAGLLSEQRLFDPCVEPNRMRRSLDPSDAEFTEAWGRTVAALDRLHQDVARDRARLVLVAIPASAQIDRRSFEFEKAIGFEMHEAWLSETPRSAQALADWARKADVPFFDLTEVFRAAGKPLYYLEDYHLNPAGSAAAAEGIAEFLSEVK